MAMRNRPVPYIETTRPRRNLHPNLLDADFSYYETVDFAKSPDKHSYRITSKGRVIQLTKKDRPKLGDLYLTPTGIKDIYYLQSCKSDSYKRPQLCVKTIKWVGGRENEQRGG